MRKTRKFATLALYAVAIAAMPAASNAAQKMQKPEACIFQPVE